MGKAELINAFRQKLSRSTLLCVKRSMAHSDFKNSWQCVVLIQLHMSEFRWSSGGNVRGEDYSEMKRYLQ